MIIAQIKKFMYSSQGQSKWVQGIDIYHAVISIEQYTAHSRLGAQIKCLAQNAPMTRRKLSGNAGRCAFGLSLFPVVGIET